MVPVWFRSLVSSASLTTLAFKDDQRKFDFPSFSTFSAGLQPSTTHKEVAASLIDAMQISPSAFLPENIFNPYIQRHRRATLSRIKEPNCPLPEVDPRVRRYMEPTPEMLADAKGALHAFQRNFKFTAVEQKSQKRKYFWSDGNDDKKAKTNDGVDGGSDGSGNATDATGSGATSAPPAPVVTTVSSLTPVPDFMALLAAAGDDEGAVREATKLMRNRITSCIADGATTAYYKKALACVKALREQSLSLGKGQGDAFNEFLNEGIKVPFSSGMHGAFWDLLVEAKVTLITSTEDATLSSTVTEADAEIFLSEDAAASQPTMAAAEEDDDEDDLFGDVE